MYYIYIIFLFYISYVYYIYNIIYIAIIYSHEHVQISGQITTTHQSERFRNKATIWIIPQS